MVLSSELYARCRITLLKCSEFESDASLQRTVFVSELRIYRDGLPQTVTREDRVDQTLDYLVQQHLSGNKFVIPLFLTKLRDRRQHGQALRDELDQLCTVVKQELEKLEYIDIPFVIVAMTHQEATDLMTESVFDNPTVAPVERTRFQQFKDSFQEHDIVDLLPHYGAHRENWKPHIYQQSTIQEIISDIADFINQRRSEMPGLPLVCPQFFSSGFFTEDEETRLETWDQLGRLGCVIIIDAVSMFHPTLRDTLLRSEMGSNERAAMLVLSPVNSSAIPVNRLIEQEIGSQMQRAFARFSKHLDRLCEFGVGDLRALQRWLFATLPEAATIVQNRKPNSTSLEIFRTKTEEPPKVEGLVFRKRGGR